MKFKHTETQKDGGGNLIVIAETKPEILEVAKHFRIFDSDTTEGVCALAKALAQDSFTYESKPTKGKWYVVESSLAYDSTKPYADLLEKLTGFGSDGAMLPDMDLTPFHPDRLKHTFITDRLWLDGGHLCFVAYDTSEDWNGHTAAERALETVTDYMIEDFGFRRFEREYIQAANGQMKHNPNYLKRHKAQPDLSSPWLWDVLFNWWRENRATAEQKRLLAASEELRHGWRSDADWSIRKGGGEQATLVSYSGLHVKSDTGTDWDGKGTKFQIVKWEDFAKLGKEVVAA